ncbi:MAG: citrate lyase holo-[Bacteroidales bacterium]|nr:citrate lyase holo-[acyl-carrier protein] synthase [Bacteroidales bacterium]
MTLEDLLRSRDARVERQRELIALYPGMTLLCLTVQLPGPVKRNDASLRIARAGVDAVKEAFKPVFEEQRDLETGFEAFFVVDVPLLDAKRICCRIEDTHPLGRLMDIDVITSMSSTTLTLSGPLVMPLGREELGLQPRRCLLCDSPAKECIRARTHTVGELMSKIDEILKNTLNL